MIKKFGDSGNIPIDRISDNINDKFGVSYSLPPFSISASSVEGNTKISFDKYTTLKRLDQFNHFNPPEIPHSNYTYFPDSRDIYEDLIKLATANLDHFKRFILADTINANLKYIVDDESVRTVVRLICDWLYYPSIQGSWLHNAFDRLVLSFNNEYEKYKQHDPTKSDKYNSFEFSGAAEAIGDIKNMNKSQYPNIILQMDTIIYDYSTFVMLFTSLLYIYIIARYTYEPKMVNSMHPELALTVKDMSKLRQFINADKEKYVMPKELSYIYNGNANNNVDSGMSDSDTIIKAKNIYASEFRAFLSSNFSKMKNNKLAIYDKWVYTGENVEDNTVERVEHTNKEPLVGFGGWNLSGPRAYYFKYNDMTNQSYGSGMFNAIWNMGKTLLSSMIPTGMFMYRTSVPYYEFDLDLDSNRRKYNYTEAVDIFDSDKTYWHAVMTNNKYDKRLSVDSDTYKLYNPYNPNNQLSYSGSNKLDEITDKFNKFAHMYPTYYNRTTVVGKYNQSETSNQYMGFGHILYRESEVYNAITRVSYNTPFAGFKYKKYDTKLYRHDNTDNNKLDEASKNDTGLYNAIGVGPSTAGFNSDIKSRVGWGSNILPFTNILRYAYGIDILYLEGSNNLKSSAETDPNVPIHYNNTISDIKPTYNDKASMGLPLLHSMMNFEGSNDTKEDGVYTTNALAYWRWGAMLNHHKKYGESWSGEHGTVDLTVDPNKIVEFGDMKYNHTPKSILSTILATNPVGELPSYLTRSVGIDYNSDSSIAESPEIYMNSRKYIWSNDKNSVFSEFVNFEGLPRYYSEDTPISKDRILQAHDESEYELEKEVYDNYMLNSWIISDYKYTYNNMFESQDYSFRSWSPTGGYIYGKSLGPGGKRHSGGKNYLHLGYGPANPVAYMKFKSTVDSVDDIPIHDYHLLVHYTSVEEFVWDRTLPTYANNIYLAKRQSANARDFSSSTLNGFNLHPSLYLDDSIQHHTRMYGGNDNKFIGSKADDFISSISILTPEKAIEDSARHLNRMYFHPRALEDNKGYGWFSLAATSLSLSRKYFKSIVSPIMHHTVKGYGNDITEDMHEYIPSGFGGFGSDASKKASGTVYNRDGGWQFYRSGYANTVSLRIQSHAFELNTPVMWFMTNTAFTLSMLDYVYRLIYMYNAYRTTAFLSDKKYLEYIKLYKDTMIEANKSKGVQIGVSREGAYSEYTDTELKEFVDSISPMMIDNDEYVKDNAITIRDNIFNLNDGDTDIPVIKPSQIIINKVYNNDNGYNTTVNEVQGKLYCTYSSNDISTRYKLYTSGDTPSKYNKGFITKNLLYKIINKIYGFTEDNTKYDRAWFADKYYTKLDIENTISLDNSILTIPKGVENNIYADNVTINRVKLTKPLSIYKNNAPYYTIDKNTLFIGNHEQDIIIDSNETRIVKVDKLGTIDNNSVSTFSSRVNEWKRINTPFIDNSISYPELSDDIYDEFINSNIESFIDNAYIRTKLGLYEDKYKSLIQYSSAVLEDINKIKLEILYNGNIIDTIYLDRNMMTETKIGTNTYYTYTYTNMMYDIPIIVDVNLNINKEIEHGIENVTYNITVTKNTNIKYSIDDTTVEHTYDVNMYIK